MKVNSVKVSTSALASEAAPINIMLEAANDKELALLIDLFEDSIPDEPSYDKISVYHEDEGAPAPEAFLDEIEVAFRNLFEDPLDHPFWDHYLSSMDNVKPLRG